MTLDETIKFEELIVESCESTARLCAFNDPYEPDVVFENNKCAKKHKQIAKWLRQLQDIQEIIEEYRKVHIEVMDSDDAFTKICDVVDKKCAD